MSIPFLLGIAGSLILVTGAAYPAHAVAHPVHSTKNWLFFIGGFCMFAYSYLNYLNGGPIFFVLLQGFIAVSSILMMLNTPDTFDAPVLTIAGIIFIIWSLMLFEDASTVFFILGLSGIGIGYALQTGTLRRNVALTVGSGLIALFSFIAGDWIFFWLNVFFAGFSAWNSWKLFRFL